MKNTDNKISKCFANSKISYNSYVVIINTIPLSIYWPHVQNPPYLWIYSISRANFFCFPEIKNIQQKKELGFTGHLIINIEKYHILYKAKGYDKDKMYA